MFIVLISFITSSISAKSCFHQDQAHRGMHCDSSSSTAACPSAVHHKAAFLQQKNIKFHSYSIPLHYVVYSLCSSLLLFAYTGACGVMCWSMPVTYHELCFVLCTHNVPCDMSTSEPGQGKPAHGPLQFTQFWWHMFEEKLIKL